MTPPTRTALLHAAEHSFATHGFPGTSIRNLAAAVGIKESSFYNHFASKQALFDAVLERAEHSLSTVAEKFHIPIDDAAKAVSIFESVSFKQLEAATLGFLEMWIHDPDFVTARRLLTVAQYRTPRAKEALRMLTIERPLAFQSEIFTALIAKGLFYPAEPEALALAFWGPIFVILQATDSPEHEATAKHQLQLHLQHFHNTYAVTTNS